MSGIGDYHAPGAKEMLKFTGSVNRLTIAQRFLASVCLFSLPLGVLFYFNIDQLSEKIEFGRSEIAGNRFQRPGVRLVKALADYEAAILTGSAVAATEKQRIDGLMRQLEDADKEVGARLGFTAQALPDAGMENLRVPAIEAKWDAVKNDAVNASSKAASDRYEALMSDVRGLIGHAGDTSNLTLDPEMDTYYLADVTSVTVAQTLNRIGSAMVTMEPLLKARGLEPSDRIAVAVFGATLNESDFERITGDLDTALKENAKASRGPSPTLRAATEPLLARYKTDVQALIDLLTACGQGRSVSLDRFQQFAGRASQSSLELWEKTVSELDGVLGMRMDGFARYRLKLVLGTCVALALALLVMVLTARGVTRPLHAAVAHVAHVAEGDLSRELPTGYLARGDEIGTLARAMQEMSARLRGMVGEISGGVEALSSAASLLQTSSARMTSESRNASDKAHSVAAAAEQMSANVTSLAAGMEQTTANLGNVASSTEHMTSTIGEIAGNSERARGVTHEATVQAGRITEQIDRLGEAARGISKFTETIAEISAQTNLLALNATIEAARAGAAGKGFAVVASEIKALALQAAAATGDINSRIAGVQKATEGGIAEVEKVARVIREVTGIVDSIAAAIEEQSTAARDIAHNIAEASAGVRDANERVAQSSQVSKEIARDIGTVDHAASEMSGGSGQVRSGAEEVSRISAQLLRTVEKFKV